VGAAAFATAALLLGRDSGVEPWPAGLAVVVSLTFALRARQFAWLSGDRSEGQLLGSVRPRRLPRGRALLVRTGESLRTVQAVLRPKTGGEVEGVGLSR